MPKQITKTPTILAAMQKIAGDGVDVAALAAFETIVLNTLPINKRGSIFDKARSNESVLKAMAAYINEKGLPLHTLHRQSAELPVGKVFSAEVVINDGGLPELRALFYVDPTETELVSKLDIGTIDEVSVGFLAQHALCSECGFDYFGPDATMENFWSRTCDKGHVIGEDGVHLQLSGLDRFYELSLVSQGAAQGAKIVSRAQAVLAKEQHQKLAASGIDLHAAVLFASTKEPKMADNKPEGHTLDLSSLVTQLTDAKVELKDKTDQVTALTAERDDLKTKLDELNTKVADLSKQLEESKDAQKITDLTAQVEMATKFLREQTRKVLVALGETEPKVDEMSISDMVSKIDEAQTKLSALIPVGGAAKGAVEDVEDADKSARLAAFKTRKK